MHIFWSGLVLTALAATVGAQASYTDPFKEHTITAPDGSITAKFIGSGASLSELWVRDKFGGFRDVVLGYDDTTLWQTDPGHPVFNSIVGRYANRIKNGTFSIPISQNPDPNSPNTYHIFRNINGPDSAYTLHGGAIGWDRRNWTLVNSSPSSLTFQHLDPADEGFPGNVTAKVTFTLSAGGKYDAVVTATATEKTPIMVTAHVYWNLDAFQETSNIFNHSLRIDSSKYIEGNGYLIPTGSLPSVQGTALDFRKERTIGSKWNDSVGYGGCSDCYGYDTPYIYDTPNAKTPNLSLYSASSGIRMDVTTNQPVVQIYTANWLALPRKKVHGGPNLQYESFSAVAIEPEGYVDAINNPAWGVDQIYYPGRDFKWATTYKFSVEK
ncbi:aldose 1-epimerase [Rhizoctonia solani 123E]|uniref:Aldose 1-epimerase n=1 Tax=Rhizoctonia solani 123E TaxID=1423351 RepID=A0A074RXM9_9AGAM|nr:aldose 1-epimerase [Rhizoctonia solani 123E]